MNPASQLDRERFETLFELKRTVIWHRGMVAKRVFSHRRGDRIVDAAIQLPKLAQPDDGIAFEREFRNRRTQIATAPHNLSGSKSAPQEIASVKDRRGPLFVEGTHQLIQEVRNRPCFARRDDEVASYGLYVPREITRWGFGPLHESRRRSESTHPVSPMYSMTRTRHLIPSYVTGSLSARQRQRFEQALGRDCALRGEYRQFLAIEAEFRSLDRQSFIDPDVAVAAVVARAHQEFIAAAARAHQRRERLRRTLSRLPLAWTVIALPFMVFVFLLAV